MSVELTKRGEVFHLEGTIRVGKATFRCRETTGCRDEESARVILARRVAEITEELLRGDTPRKQKKAPGFATAAADYLDYKAKGNRPLGKQDRAKLLTLGEYFGEKSADSFEPEDWDEFVEDNLDDPAPATVRRWYAMFSPPLRRTAAKFKFILPDFTLPEEGPIRPIFLEPKDRDGLLAEYAEHAKPISVMLCFQGCRASEALRVQWPDVSFSRNTLTFRRTKNGDTRVVPMHPEVRASLTKLYHGQTRGPVFLKPDGTPYADRREASHGDGRDGSGIRTAHATALRRFVIKKLLQDQKICRHCTCRMVAAPGGSKSACAELAVVRPAGVREEIGDYALACASCHKKYPELAAKINFFRVHDFRHHWASWFCMDGGSESSLMVLGGWKSPKMVQRYVALAVEHLEKQLAKSQRRQRGKSV